MTSKPFRALNIIFLLLVGFGFLARIIPPNVFGYFQYFAFLLTPFSILSGLLIVFNFRNRDFFYYINIFVFILLMVDLRNNFQWNYPEESNKKVKVVNFNVGGFTFHHNAFVEIAELLQSQDADIICLQEFGKTGPGRTDSILPVFAGLIGMPNYRYFHHPDNNYGLVVFSKHQFQKAVPVSLPITITNGCVYAQLDVSGKSFGIIGIHLYSFNFKKLKEVRDRNVLVKSLFVNDFIQQVYRQQTVQFNRLARYASSINCSHVIAGDLNCIPDSYFYNQLTQKYDDSFMEKGRGRGLTYPFLSARIDYQFCSKQLKVLKHEVLKSEYSDHYAVAVTYDWNSLK